MIDFRSPTIYLLVSFLLFSTYLVVKWQLAKEEAAISYYAFQLAAAKESANPDGDCGLLLKRMPGLGDIVERNDDGTTIHRWSTAYRVGAFTRLLHGQQWNGHYWADVVCSANGTIVQANFGFA